MDIDVIINADNRSWDDTWLPIHRHADMAHQSFINNAVDDAAVISTTFRTPADNALNPRACRCLSKILLHGRDRQ